MRQLKLIAYHSLVFIFVLMVVMQDASAQTPYGSFSKNYKLGSGLFPAARGANPILEWIDFASNHLSFIFDIHTSHFPTLCQSGNSAAERFAHEYEDTFILPILQYAQARGLEVTYAFDFAPDRTNHVGSANTFSPGICAGAEDEPLIPEGERHFGNPVVVNALKEEAIYIASVIKPKYFAFGVEIDSFLKDSTPQERLDFWNAFREIKMAAQQAAREHGNPNMKFFCYYQYENVVLQDLWYLIVPNKDESDLYGFDSYPVLSGSFQTGSQFPSTFYRAITNHFGTRKNIAIPELGQPWQTIPNVYDVGLNGELDQDQWMHAFFNSIQGLPIEFVNYLMSYDFHWPETVFFDHMGLRRDDGSARPSWNTFIQRSSKRAGSQIPSILSH